MEIATVFVNAGDGFSRHRHHADALSEFHFIFENGGKFDNDDREYEAKAGSLFFSGPEVWHQAWIGRKDQRMAIYSVSFRPEPRDEALMNLLGKRFADAPMIPIGKGNALAFEDMRRKVATGDSLLKQAANYRLMSFIYDILSGQTSEHRPRGRMYVDEALRMMQGNITGSLDLDQVARRLGIEKSYFIRLFKEIMGIPPLKYYLRLKMDAAAFSLRSSAKSVRQVAADFGYADECYFSRAFKNHVGVSPQEFRSSR